MISSPMHLLPTILLLASATVLPGALSIGNTPLINKTCTEVLGGNYYDFCMHALSSDPAASSATDRRGLTIAAANFTAHNVTTTLQVLVDLVWGLNKCIGYYNDSSVLLAGAIDDLSTGRSAETAYEKLARAADGPGNCDILLFQGPAMKDPVQKENTYIGSIGYITREIAGELVTDGPSQD